MKQSIDQTLIIKGEKEGRNLDLDISISLNSIQVFGLITVDMHLKLD